MLTERDIDVKFFHFEFICFLLLCRGIHSVCFSSTSQTCLNECLFQVWGESLMAFLLLISV